MERAQHKFKILKTRNEWEAPTPEDEKLLALESTVTKLKSKLEDQKKKSPKKTNDGGSKFGKYKGKGGDGKVQAKAFEGRNAQAKVLEQSGVALLLT